MLNFQIPCFLLIPNEQNKRLLVPARVLELHGDDAVVELEELVVIEPGCDATIFAEWRGKFHQQAIQVTALREAPEADLTNAIPDLPPIVIAFKRIGEPVSAENRGSYRVSIAASELHGRVGNQPTCHIVDVSPEGCAVICPQSLTIGQTVNVSFTFDGISVEGPMKVQTATILRNGKLRFGLFAAQKKSATRRSLEKLSMAAQRRQLQRLAGAA